MRQSTLDAIKRMKEIGFSYIKVELEAQLGRRYHDEDCYECYGNGTEDCYECDGSGAIDSGERVGVHQEIVMGECDACYGDGALDCLNCEGSGTGNRFSDEGECHNFMAGQVSDNARRKLIYGNFYDDGSVDSEFTFTVHIDDAETILEWIEAFKSLSYEVGDGIDVSGAGMHISVLPTDCGGSYPCYDSLDYDKMANFSRQMTTLMPALFFLATPDHRTRPLEYRYPRVSDDDKFSAIYTHGDTCLEYRVFDTCYDNPEKMYDNIEVIANSLEFYDNPNLTVENRGKEFYFNDADYIANLFKTPDAVRALNRQLKHLKPKRVTMKKLKEERQVPVTVSEVVAKHRQRVQDIRADYNRVKKINQETLSKPLTDEERDEMDKIMAWTNESPTQALMRVRNVEQLPELSEFIRRQVVGWVDFSVRV